MDAALLDTEAAQRARVVACARTWTGTPWHHHAAVKGHGVDCAFLLLEVFSEAGVIERFDPPDYPPDAMNHRDFEFFAETVQRFAVEFDPTARKPEPGDVLLWKYGRTYSHGGIVTCADPLSVVHAYALSGIVEEGEVEGTPMAERPMRAFSLW